MKLVFLDWNRPVLHTAVDYLIREIRKRDGARFDMGNFLCVFSGGRAGRRFEEILLAEVEKLIDTGKVAPDWTPPQILTLGRLPEELYPLKQPRADDLTQQFAWIAAIRDYREIAPDLLARLLPNLPEDGDLDGWLELGRLFGSLHRELAADTLDCSRVAALCRELGVEPEARRWDTLADLEQGYLGKLDMLKLWDIQTARLFALEHEEPRKEPPHRKEILLIGTADLNRTQKHLLEMVEDRVTALVFAPESHRPYFDPFGCVLPEAWNTQVPIDIPDSDIRVETTVSDQAHAVLEWLGDFGKTGTILSPDRITIGVADEEIVPVLNEMAGQCDLRVRYGAGIPLHATSVYRLLDILRRFLHGRRFSDFSDLLRHPVTGALRTALPVNPDASPAANRQTTESGDDILTELDIYRNTFLPQGVPTKDADWRRLVDEENPRFSRDFAALRAIAAEWERLLAPLSGGFSGSELSADAASGNGAPVRKRPGEWGAAIRSLLYALFPGAVRRSDRLIREALAAVEAVLDRMDTLPSEMTWPVPVSETLAMLLRLLDTRRIPPESDREAVEMLGWLELAMDDAEVMAVTGMNEGVISSSRSSDMFLPDGVRRHLGLEDNDRRFARDAYALSVILNSRRSTAVSANAASFNTASKNSQPPKVLLVFGRRSADGDPLLPSRLFFATDPETVARRACRFFSEPDEDSAERPVVFPGTLRPGRSKAAFKPPELPPSKVEAIPSSMRVTEFRDYLTCPYRYFLRHRLKLAPLDDTIDELDGASFGSLLHDVLRAFGQAGDITGSTVAEPIARWLDDELDNRVRDRFGLRLRPTVAVQVEQSRHRLHRFARWQADWTGKGFRILETELPFEIPLDVDGIPMLLRGRIDRIDRHAETGDFYVFDYKTSESGKEPEKTHRTGKPKRWIDLQLPLYGYALPRVLAQAAGIPNASGSGEAGPRIVLGYILLPPDATKTGEALAPWNSGELDEALLTAKNVVRGIRAGDFEMVTEPPRFFKEFAAICLDNQIRM